MALPNLSVVNTWTFGDAGSYAPVPVPVSNTEGNALVAVIGVGSNNVSGYCPRIMIADDAHNWWTLAGSSFSNFPGASRRLDIWVCENARNATTISVTASQAYAGIGGAIYEMANFPLFASIDFNPSTGGFAATSTLSGTAHQADYVIGALATFGGGSGAITLPTVIPTALTVATAPGSGMGQLGIAPSYAAGPVAAGAVSATWSWVNTVNYMTVLVGFSATPSPPVQPNPNYPPMITEAAFGFSPGLQTGGNPTWTSLANRVTGDEQSNLLHSTRGRDYELTQPEAGELDITFDNLDGALNPIATGSPFYPNVVPEVPVRASSYWAGRRFGLGFSYANGWPQGYPNRQWGEVAYTGKDAIGIISQGSMPSAYAGEVLADFPSTYYNLGEYYESPHGALFANLSRVNQIPMIGFSPSALGTDYQLSTGQTMNLLGDSSTGIGVTGIVGTDLLMVNGAGVLVRDKSLPQILNATAAYECWVTGPIVAPAGTGNGKQVRLLAAFGHPSNYQSPSGLTSPGQIIGVYATPTSPSVVTWTITLSDHTGTTISSASGTTGPLVDAHIVAMVSGSGSSYQTNLFINGASVTTGSGTSSQDVSINLLVGGPVNPNGGLGFSNNYVISQIAAYPTYNTILGRLASHYNVGTLARLNAAGDSITQRISALMLWSGLGVPYGMATTEVNPLLGNADQVSGGALADNLYTTALEEGGMFYAAATANGEIWYAPRTTFYNRSPKVTLGDNPIDVNNGNPTFQQLNGWGLTGLSGTDAVDKTAQGYHSGQFTVNASGLTQAYTRYVIPVTANASYMLTGCIEAISGNGNYGLAIDWHQANGTYISTSGSPAWQNAYNGSGWAFFNAGTWSNPFVAPANAAYAYIGPTCYVSTGTINVGTQFNAAQFWLTCVSSEIPYDPGSGFDYSDTYIYNIVSSQLTLATGLQYFIGADGLAQQGQYSSLGPNAIAADQASETQYFPRGPLQQPTEAATNQDAFDRANWTLASYKQPQLRANQVSIDCEANPGVLTAILRLEQGDMVAVNRRPVGAPVISITCMIQKIEIVAGPNVLTVILTLSPYFPANSVLRADDPTYSLLGTTALPW